MEALKRIQANTVEKRLLNARGQPNFGINFYILNAKGRARRRHAVRSRQPRQIRRLRRERRAALETCDALLEGGPE